MSIKNHWLDWTGSGLWFNYKLWWQCWWTFG